MLERLEIEVFLTLTEELHFGRAAARLGVSTGRVSQVVKSLERRAGARLFDRSSRHVALTPLGRLLDDELRPPYRRVAAAWEHVVRVGQSGGPEVTVGSIGAAAGRVATRAVEAYRAGDPARRARVRDVQPVDCLRAVRDGTVDVLVLPLPHDEPDMEIGPVLFSEARMLAAPAGHPLTRRADVTVEHLAEIPLLRLPAGTPSPWGADRAPQHTPQGRPVAAGPRFDTVQEALTLVGAGAGGFVAGAQLTRYYARDDIAYLPVRDAPPLEWVPTWLAATPAPVVGAVVDALVGAARELGLSCPCTPAAGAPA